MDRFYSVPDDHWFHKHVKPHGLGPGGVSIRIFLFQRSDALAFRCPWNQVPQSMALDLEARVAEDSSKRLYIPRPLSS